MRTVTCTPILGFFAAALYSQTPSDCNDTLNRTVVQRAAPGAAQTGSAFQPPLPVPECVLCVVAAPEKPIGVNRNPIYRAIRSLGSRVFPGNEPGARPRKNTTLLRRFWRGSDFRVVLGKSAETSPPCPAPASPVQ